MVVGDFLGDAEPVAGLSVARALGDTPAALGVDGDAELAVTVTVTGGCGPPDLRLGDEGSEFGALAG